MIEQRQPNGLSLRAEALKERIFHVQAAGHDGYAQSLLERYGLVNPLPPENNVTESDDAIALPDGLSLRLTQNLGFELRRGQNVLVASLEGTKVATAPTVYRNQGCQLDLRLSNDEKLIGFGDHQRQQIVLNGLKDSLWDCGCAVDTTSPGRRNAASPKRAKHTPLRRCRWKESRSVMPTNRSRTARSTWMPIQGNETHRVCPLLRCGRRARIPQRSIREDDPSVCPDV